MTIGINGAMITDEAIARETLHHGDAPAPTETARYALAIGELLLQEARRVAIAVPRASSVEETEEALIEALLDQEVQVPQPTEAECRRYYDAHRDRFVSGELVEVSHILFAVTPGTPIGPLRAKAEQFLTEIKADPSRFGDYASRYSNCPSGQLGGNLGQLGRGQMVPEFEAELFAGGSRVLSRLVRTRFGFHIVRVERRIEGTRLPFEMVHERIAAYLSAQVRRKAVQQYVRLLAGKARVEGIDLDAAVSPLLQ